MRKRKRNPKRKISPSIDEEIVERLVQKIVYAGSSAHKRSPGNFGLKPPMQPRINATLCEVTQISDPRLAIKLLRKGVKLGLISVQMRNGFPQNIWAVSENGYALEAQLGNQENGEYHGYPMDSENDKDPLAGEVKRRIVPSERHISYRCGRVVGI
jgi:hypothetical protein